MKLTYNEVYVYCKQLNTTNKFETLKIIPSLKQEVYALQRRKFKK